jgi:diaminopimelate epimerase
MKTDVWIMSGAGNLFTVLDNRESQFTHKQASNLAKTLCNNPRINRKPTEGLMMLNKSNEYDFECWFFNPDGSSGMMCGNGGRCILAFAEHLEEINSSSVRFEMNSRIYNGKTFGQEYQIEFDPPAITEARSLNINDKVIEGIFVDNTSDHFCIDYNKLADANFQSQDRFLPEKDQEFESFDIRPLARQIQMDSKFPNSVNINFYSTENENDVRLRTFERGVNSETGACGTGALATGVAVDINYQMERPYRIIPTSKIPISVDLKGDKHLLTGPAEILGKLSLEL